MIALTLIGIGTGNPDHLTLQAVSAMRDADLILIPTKGEDKDQLAEIRRQICDAHLDLDRAKLVEFELPVRDPAIADYRARVDQWHDAIALCWQKAITDHIGVSGRVGFLVWGDPSLYDSTLRIAERVANSLPLEMTVIPGITSIQALTAAHKIPLNRINAPVTITTGRQIRDHGFPAGSDMVVVMLDGELSFRELDPDGLYIWWSGYAGMREEINISGAVADVTPQIEVARKAARAENGWIMDIYLLSRA